MTFWPALKAALVVAAEGGVDFPSFFLALGK